MKNQCQHTGQNAAFKLLFSHIPISEILAKNEKTIDFGRRIWISPELFPEKVKRSRKRRIESQKFRKRLVRVEKLKKGLSEKKSVLN